MAQSFTATRYPNLYTDDASGIYYARVDVGRKMIRRSLKTKDLPSALSRLAAFLSEYSGEEKEIINLSWHAAVGIYLAKQRNRPELKPRALESVEYFAGRAKRLVESDMECERIGEAYCMLWWKKEASSGCSARTANGSLHIVKSVFAMLCKMGSIKSDPTAEIKKLTLKRNPLNIPGKEDFSRIVEEIRNAPHLKGYKESTYSESADLVEFLSYSGLRIEEARRLEWKDIGKESISVPDIKHATERRTLYINPALQDIIERIRANHKQSKGAIKVFSVKNPRKALTNACIRLEIAHVRVHDLRHFFATSCIESGIDIPTVSRWLGHRDGGALAMKVYGHLRDAHSREQAARVRF